MSAESLRKRAYAARERVRFEPAQEPEDVLAGFTPYARTVIYNDDWSVKDNSVRLFVMGHRDSGGKRVREQQRAMYSYIWALYRWHNEHTHLWVVRDGRRHLIHKREKREQ